jgi:hypothetical protein
MKRGPSRQAADLGVAAVAGVVSAAAAAAGVVMAAAVVAVAGRAGN